MPEKTMSEKTMPETNDTVNVVVFGAPSVAPDSYRPDDQRILAGSPDQKVWNYFTDTTGQFSAGIWEGAPGKWRVSFTENEFCHLLTGRVVVRDDAGTERCFTAGDSFVMTAGFTGTWEVLETARKLYAVFEARSPAS